MLRMNSGGGSSAQRDNPVKVLRRLIRARSVVEKIVYPLLVLAIAAIVTWALAKGSPPKHVTVECDAPPRILPGKLATLAYDIKTQAAVDVGLGAGLYDEDGVDHSRGTGDRDSVGLQRGNNRVTRPFMVPADLPAGTYELNAEIWPANLIGDDGVETLADSPCGFVTIP